MQYRRPEPTLNRWLTGAPPPSAGRRGSPTNSCRWRSSLTSSSPDAGSFRLTGGEKEASMAMDPQAKKVALRAINYGLYVLTAVHDGEYGAAGVNWLSQASFEPPLVMVGVK